MKPFRRRNMKPKLHLNDKGNYKRGGAAEGRATSFVVAAASGHLCICCW